MSEIVEKWDIEVCKPIFSQLANKISELSIQKYSSPVIETCLKAADEQTRAFYIQEIAASSKLHTLINHNYGNYVVQSALRLANPVDKMTLINAIKLSIPQIQDKKVRQKWQQEIIQKTLKELKTADPNNAGLDQARSTASQGQPQPQYVGNNERTGQAYQEKRPKTATNNQSGPALQ